MSISNHQPYDCLLNRLFRHRCNKTSKLRVTGLCEGNSPVTGEFPAQRASKAKNVSISWSHISLLWLNHGMTSLEKIDHVIISLNCRMERHITQRIITRNYIEWWSQMQDIAQAGNIPRTVHSSSSLVSYGVYFMSILENNCEMWDMDQTVN